jgi:hypothetical protein
MLAPRPTPKDHPLSAVRECVSNIFAATLHIWQPFLHPQPGDAPCRGDRPTYHGLHAQRLTTGRKLFGSFQNKVPGHNKSVSSLPRNRLKFSPASSYTCANLWLKAGSETKRVDGRCQVTALFDTAFLSTACWL